MAYNLIDKVLWNYFNIEYYFHIYIYASFCEKLVMTFNKIHLPRDIWNNSWYVTQTNEVVSVGDTVFSLHTLGGGRGYSWLFKTRSAKF